MSEVHLTRKAYTKLIDEDIEWLEQNTPPCLERDHIIFVLKESINMYCGCIPNDQLNNPDNGDKKITIILDKSHGINL